MPGLVIAGATVFDGTGAPGRRVDVRVADGRIAEVGDRLSGRRTVAAAGLALAPGFVDLHSHSDLALLTEPEHLAKVSQGVTLEVLGQDGLSYAPVDDTTLAALREQLAGWNGDPPGFDWDWRSVGGYLPGWAADGGPAATLARLSDPDTRERILVALERTGSDGCHGVPVDWTSIEINAVRHERNVGLVGRSVAESADRWGTFPRYLGRYVRELGVLGLAECVAHLTSRPARRLGLADRGLVRVGAVADLVPFDPDTIADTATFADPRRQATGVHTVLVDGVAVLSDGRPTGALPGHSIRSRSARAVPR